MYFSIIKNEIIIVYDIYTKMLSEASVNTNFCVHCGNVQCSATEIICSTQKPVYEYDPNKPTIDVSRMVVILPQELLEKIYTDYFRPHKFAQLYRGVTGDTIHKPLDYMIHKTEFIRHFRIFQ